MLRWLTAGESHGPALVAVLEGLPSGVSVTTDDLPVTVSFTRRADPGQAREMTAWVRAGLSMAEGFPGFLGGRGAAHRSLNHGLAEMPTAGPNRRQPALLRAILGKLLARPRALVFPQAVKDVQRTASEIEDVLVEG